MRDGIETKECQSMKIRVIFADNRKVTLSIFEYWFNLIFWTLPVEVGERITSKYFFNTRDITKRSIKKYIDELFVRPFRTRIRFKSLNNIIDDCLHKLKYINEFAFYLANTINFEDTLDLMKMYPEFNESIHADLSNVPIEDVKNVGMKYANLQIDYIKKSENHCLKDSFRAGEGINPKQFKEVNVSIGSKPDGRGGVYPGIINRSFINGGVSDYVSYAMESSVGRTAQILSKMNVGTSGSFARLLEINNIDTSFHPDPEFTCNTRNFEEVFIKDDTWLKIYDMRYYRTHPEGIDKCIDYKTDKFLIGKTVYMRSPMTCSSFAHGDGICHKCYGDMYFVVRDINPGKIAAELLSAVYTQMLLSAKHLLESAVIAMKWSEGFDKIFEVNMNTITVIEDTDFTGYKLLINPEHIESDDDDDNDITGLDYGEYITSFDIVYPNGDVVTMHTADEDQIYITGDLNRMLKSKKAKELDDGTLCLDLNTAATLPAMFLIKIKNKELSRTLERSKHIIDKSDVTSSFDRNQILREFITTNLEGGLNVNAVHCEVLFANQMRDPENLLEKPHWETPNVPYKILTLNSSLTNNASITIALEFQKIAKTLVSPLSTKKVKASRMDVFFMEQPQEYIGDNGMISDEYNFKEDKEENIVPAVYFYDEIDE
ncbi:MAG: hypothetical protein IKA36_02180 [Clostridia bacterium]|nr:hypothetical protein [Clostridia bacterium]